MTTPTLKIYEVGGFVRDELLGIKSKDRDCTVAIEGVEDLTVEQGLEILRDYLNDNGYEIFVDTPEHATIRAHQTEEVGRGKALGLPADFVLARREGPYSDGRRPDWVEIGTLEDDLDRRDFTVNAMARSVEDGTLIDRHDGVEDLNNKILRFVGDPNQRIQEDALRVMRAFRFAITKDFMMAPETIIAIEQPHVPELLAHISEERRDKELRMMFKGTDTVHVLRILNTFSTPLLNSMFAGRVRLTSTLKK